MQRTDDAINALPSTQESNRPLSFKHRLDTQKRISVENDNKISKRSHAKPAAETSSDLVDSNEYNKKVLKNVVFFRYIET